MTARHAGTGVRGRTLGKGPAWTAADDAALVRYRAEGLTTAECARRMPSRSYKAVEQRLWQVTRDRAPSAAPRPLDAAVADIAHGTRSWSVSDAGASASLAQTVFEPIRTLEDLLTVCEVDATQWDVTGFTCNAWGGGTSTEPRTLYQVKANLKRKAGATALELVQALAAGILSARKAPAIVRSAKQKEKCAQVVVIADPHFGKLCWSRGTGGEDYDVDIAHSTLMQGATQLMAGASRVEKRYIVSLGDFFHFDTLSGTTTGGTFVDRDSRMPKILEVGADALARIVRHSAKQCETELVTVSGNHDEVTSAALQRIMVAEFRGSGVQVDDTHTRRKARLYGRNLLGFNHGDKRKKELCSALAIENVEAWGCSRYREIHTGHLHTEGERYEGTITHAGVTLRTHRSLTPPDQWHSDSGFIGSPRGMSAFVYDARGGLTAVNMFDPDLERAA